MPRYLLFLFFLLNFFSTAQAQLDNRSFFEKPQLGDSSARALYLRLNHLSYLRNNEYFNNIIEGRTLFGYIISPSLVYYPLKNVRVEAGAFFRKDHGDNDFTRIAPLLRLTYQRKNTSITFGNLFGNLSHQLVEPLFAFERLMEDFQESGLQIKQESSRFYFDLWVDWIRRTVRDATEPENILGGLVTEYKFLNHAQFKADLLLQGTIFHVGGQDLAIPAPVSNTMNLATGLRLKWVSQKNAFFKSLRLENYYVAYLENASDSTQRGNAFYGNLEVDTRWFQLLLSLWISDDYNSIVGGELYRSVSVSNEGLIEQNRNLLFIRLIKDFKIMEDLHINLRVEPYYDFENQLFEYSFGVYAIYQPQFLLKRFRPKAGG